MGLSPYLSDYSGLVHNPFMWDKVCCAQPLHKNRNLGSSRSRGRGGRRNSHTWPQTLTVSATEDVMDAACFPPVTSASLLHSYKCTYVCTQLCPDKWQSCRGWRPTLYPLKAKQYFRLKWSISFEKCMYFIWTFSLARWKRELWQLCQKMMRMKLNNWKQFTWNVIKQCAGVWDSMYIPRAVVVIYTWKYAFRSI